MEHLTMHTFADSTSSHNSLLIWSVVIAMYTQAADNATDLIIVNIIKYNETISGLT